MKQFDAIVVGGGIAGLTAAAFLSRAEKSVLLLEKEPNCGGLVNAFTRDGFVYDGGIRATENAGVLFPMLKQLGLDLDFVKNHVTLGLEDQFVRVESAESLHDYGTLLGRFYPESEDEIASIMAEIEKIMGYMEIQYAIDNPAFLDPVADRAYFIKKVLPWMVKFLRTYRKVEALNEPVVDYLRQFTRNQSLLDIICQHFFTETPASFALSYLTLYLDYYYPKGGTGVLIQSLDDLIQTQGGQILTGTQVVVVDPANRTLTDDEDRTYTYKQLVWAADQNALYRSIDPESLSDPKQQAAVRGRKAVLKGKSGNDSILTLYLAVDLPPEFFAAIAGEHVFYTPSALGESVAGPLPIAADRPSTEAWLANFFRLTTYEIAIPALRDESLAPTGKTGLIVSMLFDYQLTKQVESQGWYPDFKKLAEQQIIQNLSDSIYPGLERHIIHQFSASPLTMERYTANTDGAITGWSFTNDPMPAEYRLLKIAGATKTPIPGISQAGQWTYSPAGLPISILTGKMAADRVIRELK